MSLKKRPLPVIEPQAQSPGAEPRAEPDMERTVVRVGGTDWASCAVTVERRVALLEGVSRAAVNFAAGKLEVEHGPKVKQGEIESAVEQAGYSVERPGWSGWSPARWWWSRAGCPSSGPL